MGPEVKLPTRNPGGSGSGVFCDCSDACETTAGSPDSCCWRRASSSCCRSRDVRPADGGSTSTDPSTATPSSFSFSISGVGSKSAGKTNSGRCGIPSAKPAARCQLRVKERIELTPPTSVRACSRFVREDLYCGPRRQPPCSCPKSDSFIHLLCLNPRRPFSTSSLLSPSSGKPSSKRMIRFSAAEDTLEPRPKLPPSSWSSSAWLRWFLGAMARKWVAKAQRNCDCLVVTAETSFDG